MKVNGTTKRIKLFIICLYAFSFLRAQQIQVDEIACIDFPARMVKLSKEQLKVMIDERKRDS
ncbi:MAG TPA: hypothetical protein VGB63_12910, partial [Pedobacter sp.]